VKRRALLSRPILACPILLALLLHTQPSRAADDVEAQLKADYLDKVLTLRHFYERDKLVFQSDGSLVGSAPVGPWTVDGQILVERIELHRHTLRIRGRRVCVVFDSKTKSFRDVLDWLGESPGQDRDKQEKAFQDKTVKIEIALPVDNPDATQVTSAMKAIFLAPGESIREFVPDFWRDYFDRIDGRPNSDAHSEAVLGAGKGRVSPPRQTYGQEPEFTDEARIAKYQGTILLSVVVDPSGAPRDLAIVRPLGLGLDEQAVKQVSNWKFEPGMKDGTPVPAKIMVEVSFHLY
jgi:TonB family protein